MHRNAMETKIKILITSLLALLLLTTPSSALAQPHPTDTDGNPLQTNTSYFITSPDHGGLVLGLRFFNRLVIPCPANVAQKPEPSSHGFPLRIHPADKKQTNITLGSDLNLVSLGATICVQSTVWQLGYPDRFTGHRYVRSAGVLGRPGPATVRNWFKLERADGREGYWYKVVYCPDVCGGGACRVAPCGDVGVFVENGRRWLGVGGEPLVMAFRNAGSAF